MQNFGFNVLSAAQSVIGKQEYQLVKWLGRTTNSQGYDIDEYDDPVTRSAGIYPMSREKIQSNGLDFEKQYIQIFDTGLIELLDRTQNADKIIWSGSKWKALPTANDWLAQGGWNQVLAVRVGNA